MIRRRKGPKQQAKIAEAIRPRFEEIVAITDAVCRDHLNEEYARLSRKLAEVLAREHPAIIARGAPRSWAAAIVYALGRINFLSDPAQEPHLTLSELCERFGVSMANASPKARQILDATGLFPLHPDWTVAGLMERNPLAWLVEVNGMVVDARDLPREIQEEAYRLGLIPHVPGA